ncbi:peptide chain release factor H [Aquimarina sp. AU58]|uniref:peptide chain release factor H n=1 Tax=Aquimarina sp. AU58 TaxID=1874112 RepID=UPI000D65D6D8|nr:peptide chain release factor H [Aquimarina sp. AU58]
MNQKIIQITAGRGPAECCWVVAQVLKYFLDDIRHTGVTYSIIQRVKGIENGTLQSATLKLQGDQVNALVSSWLGTVQWIGTSTFRKYHKRKNWFIGIYELDLIPIEKIAEKDIVFQTMRSSGPGGQHVNKVNSAVRATHKLTGTSVVVMDSRSQHQNRKIAVERLKNKVAEAQLEQLKKSVSDEWENHLNVQRGNPIRVFKGTDFKKKKVTKTFKNKRNQLKNDLHNQLKN